MNSASNRPGKQPIIRPLLDVVLGKDFERSIILKVAGADRIRSVFFLTRAVGLLHRTVVGDREAPARIEPYAVDAELFAHELGKPGPLRIDLKPKNWCLGAYGVSCHVLGSQGRIALERHRAKSRTEAVFGDVSRRSLPASGADEQLCQIEHYVVGQCYARTRELKHHQRPGSPKGSIILLCAKSLRPGRNRQAV